MRIADRSVIFQVTILCIMLKYINNIDSFAFDVIRNT